MSLCAHWTFFMPLPVDGGCFLQSTDKSYLSIKNKYYREKASGKQARKHSRILDKPGQTLCF